MAAAMCTSPLVLATSAHAKPPTTYWEVDTKQKTASTTYWERGTPMTPRFQWNANFGYCGETAFISAGMRFGQYTSQWKARHLASPGMDQWKAGAQLLLKVNDLRAAKAMKLDARAFSGADQVSVPQYLGWVKKRFLAGDVVIIGVLNNTKILNEWPEYKGDLSYDHIVPVFGIGSGSPMKDSGYHPTDSITISDNGLHNIGPNIPYLYTYEFATFPRTRAEANAIGGPVYALRDRPKNHGTAVSGVLDPGGVTIPVRLTSNANGEGKQNGRGPNQVMKRTPAATPITLTAKVHLPDTSKAYRVYLYDDFSDVPKRGFNAKADRAVSVWTIPAGSASSIWTVTIQAMSSDTRVFRAVPVSAP